ncbi:unnamed protein product [Rhodiola kirilowii]
MELPEHLLHSILALSPLKTLLRFSSVSKSWRETILSRSLNLDRTISDANPAVHNYVYLFRGKYRKTLFTAGIHRVWGNVPVPRESLKVKVPFFSDGFEEHEDDVFNVSTLSCDGVLCVVYKGSNLLNRILLWNPYARKCSRSVLWPEAFKDDCYAESVFVGFGYDTSISDYKIVVMKSPTTASGAWQIQVTALQSNSWREVELLCSSSIVPHSIVHRGGQLRPVTVQGDIYWIGKIRSDNSRHILKFSLAEEMLTTIPLPEEVTNKLSNQIPLQELVDYNSSGRQRRVQLGHQNNKSLYLYHYNAYPDHSLGLGSAVLEVWLYSKDAWAKVLSVSETGSYRESDLGLITPLGFTANGDFIMTCRSDNFMAAYIPLEDKLEFLDTNDILVCPKQCYGSNIAFVDMESLNKSTDMADTKEEDEIQRLVASSIVLSKRLVYSVLVNLPIKSLLRFCCLSKHWRDTILSRSFNLDRRISVANSGVNSFVYWFGNHECKTFTKAVIQRVEGNISSNYDRECLSIQVPFFSDGFEVHEDDVFNISTMSCDGLLCVVYEGGNLLKRILLWNPHARRCSRSVLWPEALKDDCYDESVFVGFGYEPSISDYKIVVMKSPTTALGKWKIQVTAVKWNSWREVELLCPSSSIPHNMVHSPVRLHPVTVQGDIYWIGKIRSDNSRHILKFSLAEETLTTLPLPEEVSNKLSTQIPNLELEKEGISGRQWRVQLGHQNNKSLFLYHYNTYPRRSLGSDVVEVWLYSNDAWMKVLSISETSISEIPYLHNIRPLGFLANGDFVLTCCNERYLATYIRREDKLQGLAIGDDLDYLGLRPKELHTCSIAFVETESLLLP